MYTSMDAAVTHTARAGARHDTAGAGAMCSSVGAASTCAVRAGTADDTAGAGAVNSATNVFATHTVGASAPCDTADAESTRAAAGDAVLVPVGLVIQEQEGNPEPKHELTRLESLDAVMFITQLATCLGGAPKASLTSNRSVQSRCMSGKVASSSGKDRASGGTAELSALPACTRGYEAQPRLKRAGFPVAMSSPRPGSWSKK